MHPPVCFCVGSYARSRSRTRNNLVILQKKVAGVSEGTLERFVRRARATVGLRGTINVLVTGRAAMRTLNRQFRGKNKATDVLSFPSANQSGTKSNLAGEIAISADIALENSVRLGHPAAQEIKILALHGILHLAGFDHERDNGEMARKEMRLRQALRLPVGLIERAQQAGGARVKHRRRAAHASGARTA